MPPAPPSVLALPPVRLLTLDSFGAAACLNDTARSPRLGGECIACGSGTVDTTSIPGGRCTCRPGYEERLAGAVACGRPLMGGSGGARAASALPADAAEVAQRLCAEFSAAKDAVSAGRLADRTVGRLYLKAFLARAGRLVDPAEAEAANATFWEELDFDPRAPASPTRRHGVAPDCNRCRGGAFVDIYSKQRVGAWVGGGLTGVRAGGIEPPSEQRADTNYRTIHRQAAPRDDRFQAVRALRLIGYMLARAGFPCPQLFDPAAPQRDDYGRHDRVMCQGEFRMAVA